MTLSDWLRENRISQSAFGARIGRSGAMVSLLCSGKTRGSVETWLRIQGETSGAVMLPDKPLISNGAAE